MNEVSVVELSISPTYVTDWTYIEAVRELFQNAIDNSVVNEDSPWSYAYNEDSEKLVITSRNSSLDRSSLLLGSTTKSDNARLIGKFGEGYKLAIMVLSREGHEVRIRNEQFKESWLPSIIRSDRFKADILSILIEDYYSGNDLVFEIECITKEMFEILKLHNLHLLSGYPDHISTENGNILLDPMHIGKIFINGLYVETTKEINIGYGYDIKSEFLRLDRDRHMVQSLDLFTITSKMWLKSGDILRIEQMVSNNNPDIKYVQYTYEALPQNIPDVVYNTFRVNHGPSAYPVISQDEINVVKSRAPGIKPIIVSEHHKFLITRCSSFKEYATAASKRPPHELMADLLTKRGNVDRRKLPKLLKLIDQSKSWMWI